MVFLSLLFVFYSVNIFADNNTSLIIDSNVSIGENVDNYIQALPHFSGAILVAKKDNIIFKKAYGYASYEFDIPNTTQTKFAIASNTKSLTALAIIQLQEKGLLHIQDTLNKYIPDFPRGDEITLHHLLTHSSGIANYYTKWSDVSNCQSLEDMITVFKNWALDFEPGSNYCYSNSGYTLLAYIIQKVSGKSFEDYLTENIFVPLAMKETGTNYGERVVKNMASGYIFKNNIMYKAPLINSPITLVGNGDVYSSIEDMYRWDQVLYSEKIISKKSIESLFVPYIFLNNSSLRAHGYGWFVDKKFDKRVVEYSGALIGFLSTVMRFVDDEITLIVLTNISDFDQFSTICNDLPGLLFG